MSNKPVIGGRNYNETVNTQNTTIKRLVRLIDEILKPGVDNGNRNRLRAEIMVCLLELKECTDTLKDIGRAAKDERQG